MDFDFEPFDPAWVDVNLLRVLVSPTASFRIVRFNRVPLAYALDFDDRGCDFDFDVSFESALVLWTRDLEDVSVAAPSRTLDNRKRSGADATVDRFGSLASSSCCLGTASSELRTSSMEFDNGADNISSLKGAVPVGRNNSLYLESTSDFACNNK